MNALVVIYVGRQGDLKLGVRQNLRRYHGEQDAVMPGDVCIYRGLCGGGAVR